MSDLLSRAPVITPELIRGLRVTVLHNTRQQFARRLGVKPWSVWAWETGRTVPGAMSQHNIAMLYNSLDRDTSRRCQGHTLCNGHRIICA